MNTNLKKQKGDGKEKGGEEIRADEKNNKRWGEINGSIE